MFGFELALVIISPLRRFLEAQHETRFAGQPLAADITGGEMLAALNALQPKPVEITVVSDDSDDSNYYLLTENQLVLSEAVFGGKTSGAAARVVHLSGHVWRYQKRGPFYFLYFLQFPAVLERWMDRLGFITLAAFIIAIGTSFGVEKYPVLSPICLVSMILVVLLGFPFLLATLFSRVIVLIAKTAHALLEYQATRAGMALLKKSGRVPAQDVATIRRYLVPQPGWSREGQCVYESSGFSGRSALL